MYLLNVANQHSPVVKFLLRYASTRVIRESRLLYKAVENGDVVTLDMLLRHADETNPLDDFPLWEAAAAGRDAEQMLRLLLAMGADVRARNSNKETVFFHVARRGLPEACRVLLEYTDGAGINDKSVDQITPFYLACVTRASDVGPGTMFDIQLIIRFDIKGPWFFSRP
ncbi:Ankyrin repeat and SOCS box protein 3 [Metarhizium anisopliae]|nr:Ankyrin repeat and SOCS box protein 3 [Metarhizium anisopliae]